MKRIVIVHGVGKHTGGETAIKIFETVLRVKTGAECVFYEWDHPGRPPVDPRQQWLFSYAHPWVQEVLMDAAWAARCYELGQFPDLPEGNMYVGHSAGGILVSGRPEPRVFMGCPIQLLKNMSMMVDINSLANILNIVHKWDMIGAPIDFGVNKYTTEPYLGFLIRAHTGYWTSSQVIAAVVRHYDTYVR